MISLTHLAAKRIGFIGFGDIGKHFAEILSAELSQAECAQAELIAIRRNIAAIAKPELCQPLACDVNDLTQLARLKDLSVDYWVISLSPDAMDEAAYRQTYLQGLSNILQVLNQAEQNARKIFWLSSTSVFAQDQHQWVDESSETAPTRYQGQVQKAAEKLLQSSLIETCVLRCSGIYRSQQHSLLNKLQAGQLPANLVHEYYTNRIHVIDVARALLHLLALDASGQAIDAIYHASDCCPVLNTELYQWLSETWQLPLNADMQPPSRRVGSKRVSNQRLRDSGFEFSFPSFREGFSQYLDSHKPSSRSGGDS